jgi:hypothetical protein
MREQRRTHVGELHVSAAPMQPEPALGDGALKTGLVFRRRALELIKERPVDLLDVDAAVLHRLEGVGPLQQLARGGVGPPCERVVLALRQLGDVDRGVAQGAQLTAIGQWGWDYEPICGA